MSSFAVFTQATMVGAMQDCVNKIFTPGMAPLVKSVEQTVGDTGAFFIKFADADGERKPESGVVPKDRELTVIDLAHRVPPSYFPPDSTGDRRTAPVTKRTRSPYFTPLIPASPDERHTKWWVGDPPYGGPTCAGAQTLSTHCAVESARPDSNRL